jgi:hypothetical protein
MFFPTFGVFLKLGYPMDHHPWNPCSLRGFSMRWLPSSELGVLPFQETNMFVTLVGCSILNSNPAIGVPPFVHRDEVLKSI